MTNVMQKSIDIPAQIVYSQIVGGRKTGVASSQVIGRNAHRPLISSLLKARRAEQLAKLLAAGERKPK